MTDTRVHSAERRPLAALSVPDTDLGESAFQALLHLWRNGNRAAVTIPLPLILATLGRLGAKREVCVGMEWVVGAQTGGVDAGTRAKIVYRLVCLLTASAR